MNRQGLAKFSREPAKRPLGEALFSIFGCVPAVQGPASSPGSLAVFITPASSYGTGPAKSEGKRFLDIGSGSSRRRLEEPLVEFPPALSGSMNDMCLERQFQDLFALVPLSDQQCQARSASHTPVAHVPFDFVVGEMLFPAGAYDVAQTEIPGTLALRRNGCEYPTALVQEIRSERNSSELLFYRQENLYFLAQVLASAE